MGDRMPDATWTMAEAEFRIDGYLLALGEPPVLVPGGDFNRQTGHDPKGPGAVSLIFYDLGKHEPMFALDMEYHELGTMLDRLNSLWKMARKAQTP